MSKKNIIERLVQHAFEKKAPGGKTHAEFLQVKSEALEAFSAGYKIKPIWELLSSEGKIEMGYQTFKKYMHRYSGKRKSVRERVNRQNHNPPPAPPRTFIYTPPDVDELLKPSSE